MSYKEYLLSLEWNSFSTYPPQGENIFLHCASYDGELHRFILLNNFNAVKLNPDKFTENIKTNQQWVYTWLPANVIKKKNE